MLRERRDERAIFGRAGSTRGGMPSATRARVQVGPTEATTTRARSAARSASAWPIRAATSNRWRAWICEVNRTASTRAVASASTSVRSGPRSSGSRQA
ncbi:MAG: hypothetical protein QM767_00705 [Anaeromyxobacter sp.]